MKKAILPVAVIALVIGLAAGGIRALRRERSPRSGAAAAAQNAPVDPLTPIPLTAGNSLTDRVIAQWVGKARASGDDDKIWVGLGDALMQKMRETADQSYYGHAERAYQKALALNPKSAEAMTGMAWVTGGRHEFDKSVAWAKQAIALDERNNAAYGLIGDADVENGDYEAALDHYQKMLDLRPDISSYSRGAHLLYLTGDTRKAMWLMTKAIQAGGPYTENTAWCRAQLALMLFDFGALLPAEQVLTDALKYTPNNYHVLAAMGRIKTARRDYPAAIDFYKKSLAVAPEHNALVALGDLYALTGKKEAAEKQYALVEKLHARMDAGGVPHTHTALAQFYADHDRNLIEAMRIAEARKTSGNVFDADTLAWVYYKNGMIAPAKEAITRALRMHTPDPKIAYHAGMIYAKSGDRGRAQRYLYRALNANPNFNPIQAPIASAALRKLGQVAGATRNAGGS